MNKLFSKLYIPAMFFLLLSGCSQVAEETVIFSGGDILTMNDDQPTIEALAIRNGRIIAAGDLASVQKISGKSAIDRDLEGRTLLPGLIDAHGHFGTGALIYAYANLRPPPDGSISNFSELKEKIKEWRQKNPYSPWIIGMGYDDSLLAEGRHPTKQDLDQISTDIPIFILHVSGHLGVCNSACLELSGISAESANPTGGVIRRLEGNQEPNGVLEETALFNVWSQLPQKSDEQTYALIEDSQNYYLENGITTVQEGGSDPATITRFQTLAEQGRLKLDVVAYQRMQTVDDFKPGFNISKSYSNNFRIGGIKLVLDGSPQGKTAWLTEPYHIVPEGKEAEYAGYPMMPDDVLKDTIQYAFRNDIPVLAHTNGDAAIDQLLNTVKVLNGRLGLNDRRTVAIHAQVTRPDQIAVMKSEDILPSYFAAHTFYWGDWHRDSVLGPERGAHISPLKSTLEGNLIFTIHNDAPVVLPNMMHLVWAAVNRQTRSGQILGSNQRISATEALKAVTINAAYQHFEENEKGSLEPGKIADLVILSDNPTTIPPLHIKGIRILETIKGGQSVYVKN